MSECTTTDLVRAIDDTVVGTGLYNIIHPLVDELFERVIDLEAEIHDQARHWSDAFAVINALRPLCTTCGGTQKGAEGMNVDGQKSWAHCPDCKDGKQSWEQVLADVAGWKAAHHKCAEFAAALEAQLTEMQEAVTRLSRVIMDEIPGEPSASEGAIDCAIRLLRERNDQA